MTLKSHVPDCEAIGTLCAIVRCLRKLSYTGIRWSKPRFFLCRIHAESGRKHFHMLSHTMGHTEVLEAP